MKIKITQGFFQYKTLERNKLKHFGEATLNL